MSMGAQHAIWSGARPLTAPIPKIATGTTTKTIMQLQPSATSPPINLVRWGISFDGINAAVPVQVELIETGTVAATVTAYTANDLTAYTDYNTIAASNFFTLGTAASGYNATAEGTPTASRLADYQLIAPTSQYIYDWSLSSEFQLTPGGILRVRVTAPASVNCVAFVVARV